MNGVRQQRYLIIGGAPKAGTTSLYKWLSDHPDVCASSLKETRFFIDEDYPIPCARRFNGANIEDYEGFYKYCSGGGSILRVEATPDYLYSTSALQIADLLPNARIVVVFRDPVERMMSWYRYAKQKRLIDESMSFNMYVETQIGATISSDTPTHWRALEQCRHEKYIAPFREKFGTRLLEIDFEQLRTNPRDVMSKICAFVSLSDEFYQGYDFVAENVSEAPRAGWVTRLYVPIRRRLAHGLHDRPLLLKIFRWPNKFIKRILGGSKKKAETVALTGDVDLVIRAYSKR